MIKYNKLYIYPSYSCTQLFFLSSCQSTSSLVNVLDTTGTCRYTYAPFTINTLLRTFFKCETFKYNADQVSGVHNTVALLLCCLCIRWLLMWSTNLWRSAITRKPMTGRLWLCDYLFLAQVLTFSHCYTWCVHCSSIIRNIEYSQEEPETPPREETLSKWKCYLSGNRKKRVNQWRCVLSNKCTESDTTVDKLTSKEIIWFETPIFNS